MEKLPITKILPDENQPRKYFAAEKIASLKDSIKKHGIMNPIIVEKQGDKFLIVDGERRFRAASELHLKEVPVIIMKTSDPISRLLEQFHIQEQHEGWTNAEKAQAILDIAEATKQPVSKVCELLSIEPRTGRLYVGIAKLQLRNKFIEYGCGITFAEKINETKGLVKRIKEQELDEPFDKASERALEKVLIEKIRDGEITSHNDISKIKDSFRSQPKLIDKFISGDNKDSVSSMFIKSKAKGAYHLRNMLTSAGYVQSHGDMYLKFPDVAVTKRDIQVLKEAIRACKDIIAAAGDDGE